MFTKYTYLALCPGFISMRLPPPLVWKIIIIIRIIIIIIIIIIIHYHYHYHYLRIPNNLPCPFSFYLGCRFISSSQLNILGACISFTTVISEIIFTDLPLAIYYGQSETINKIF